MSCIIEGCNNNASHILGVRCRQPDTTAVWSPNTAAFLCDHHAASGLRLTIHLKTTRSGEIETDVHSGAHWASRTTAIRHNA